MAGPKRRDTESSYDRADSRGGLDQLIRAVRSSLANIAGLGTAIALALNQFERLSRIPSAIWKGAPGWVGPLCVVVLLSFLTAMTTWTLVERWRSKNTPRDVRPVSAPYFSLRPRERIENFERADLAHERVLSWILSAPAPLLYLTGASGTGKSSILSAWVVPKLSVDHAVIRLRGHEDLMARMEEEVLNCPMIWDKPIRWKGDLKALLTRASRAIDPARRLFIFIDQFEEFLVVRTPEEQTSFKNFVNSIQTTSNSEVKIILSFRSEYGGVIGAEGWPRRLLDINLFEIFCFNELAAQDFMRKSPIEIEPSLLSAVLREGAEIEQGVAGLIRPITLNLCGLVLERFAGRLPAKFRGKIIRGFLEESLSLPETRDSAPNVISRLMTRNLIKQTKAVTSLVRETALSSEEVRTCLYRLGREDRGILRPMDDTQESWEISHDFLVPLLHSVIATRKTSWWHLSRPWLPWVATAAMAVIVSVFSLVSREDPTLVLAKQGWQVSEKDGIVFAKRTGPIPQESLPFLSRLPALSLHLQGPDVTDVTQIKGLSNLVQLDLNNTRVASLPSLQNSFELTQINLSFTGISDLAPVAEVKALKQLNLSFTHIRNLAPLKNLRELVVLDLHNDTDLTDIRSLVTVTGLEELDLSATSVSDVRALQGLTKLRKLDLSGTNISEQDLRAAANWRPKTLAVTGALADPNARPAECENLSGTWMTAGDLQPAIILQKGCYVSGSFKNFDESYNHSFAGTSTEAGAAIIVHRLDPGGCEADMYGFIALSGETLIYQLYGTTGQCNLSSTMREVRRWRRKEA